MAKLKLGLIVILRPGRNPEDSLDQVRSFGLPTCQVTVADPVVATEEMATRLARAAKEREIEITTVWTHCGKGSIWNFYDGPRTIGLVPAATRAAGVENLKKGSDFATWLSVPSITSHVGFIPENPNDPDYQGVVGALKQIGGYCKERGQSFMFETGQETPVTLLRTIEDVGTGNLRINLDPANLLLYGKANPVDALDVFGKYVMGVHAKDGEYPTNGRELGKEKPLGEGRVNFPVLIPKLKALGYTGALTIEREVSGPEQAVGIRKAIQLLEPLL